MRWEQTPNNSGNGSKTRRSSCNSSLLPKESGAPGQAEIRQGAALVEEQAPAPGRAREAVRKVRAPAGEREEAPVEEQAQAPGRGRARAQEAVRKVRAPAGEQEAGSVLVLVLVPVPVLVPVLVLVLDRARVEVPWERAGPESQAHRAPRLEVVMLRSGMAVGRAQQHCCAITAAGAVHPSREVGWGESAGPLWAAVGSVSRKRTCALCSASSHSSAGPAKTLKTSWTP